MTDPRAPHGSASQGAHLVLYDGVCGLCNHLVQFLLRHDRKGLFAFAPLQSAIGRGLVIQAGGDPNDLFSFHVFPNYRSGSRHAFTRSEAALFVAAQLGWPWRAAGVLRFVPARLRDWGYDLVARYRYRIFGQHEQCLLPSPESRHRFIA